MADTLHANKPHAPRASTDIADDMAVSHGRGGTGNIAKDDTAYGDGEITRQGFVGESNHNYSSGRGGAANIGTGSNKAASVRADDEIVPQEATRPSMEGHNVHVGRGGAGNVSEADSPEPATHKGLADKLKDKLFKRKSKPAKEDEVVDAPAA